MHNQIQTVDQLLQQLDLNEKKYSEQQQFNQAVFDANSVLKQQVRPIKFTNDKVRESKEKFDHRMSFIESVKDSVMPNSSTGDKIQHMADISNEALLAMVLIDYIILALDIVSLGPYRDQLSLLWDAQRSSFQCEIDGEIHTFTMAYAPNRAGLYPPIYPIDPRSKKPDFNQEPFVARSREEAESISNDQVRFNGYVPRPTLVEGLSGAWAKYVARAVSIKHLSPEQLMLVYGKTNFSQQHQAGPDTAQDVLVNTPHATQKPIHKSS